MANPIIRCGLALLLACGLLLSCSGGGDGGNFNEPVPGNEDDGGGGRANSAPNLAAPDGRAGSLRLVGTDSKFAAACRPRDNLALEFVAADNDGGDLLALTVSVTGGDLTAAQAGFNETFPYSPPEYVSPHTVFLTGTAVKPGTIELTVDVNDGRGGSDQITLTILIVYEKRRVENEEKRRVNETMTVLYGNASAHGDKIANAIAAGNEDGLAGLFDWESFAMTNRERAAVNKKLLNSPIMAQGDWAKREDGKFSGKYVGTVMRGAGGLRRRVLGVFGKTIFAVSASYDKARSEHFESRIMITIGGQKFFGRKVFVKSDACDKNLEFWVAGVLGQENVGVVYLAANSKLRALLQAQEAPYEPPKRD